MDNHSNLFIGSAIKNIRNRKRLNGKKYTQKMLAEELGVGQSYIGGMENNVRTPSFKTLAKISRTLDISLVKLVSLGEYERLCALYGNKSHRELTEIGTAESLAFRDLCVWFDSKDVYDNIGYFFDKFEEQRAMYNLQKEEQQL